ncbi:MAG: phage tail tape measure protein, partial [Gammaproteobacteria bacterium]|nr:phage tail tape measure protein [Gammaproteobacteria bacterium]
MPKIGELFVAIGADLRDFTAGLKKAEADVGGFSGMIQKHSRSFRMAGVAMVGVAAGVGVVGLKMAADFEGAMREVNTMMGLSQDEFESLSDQVLRSSMALGKAPEQMAQALYQVISAGIPAGEAMQFLGTSTRAAVGGVTDIETAVDGLTTVINAWGMDAAEATSVADIMFTTVKGGKTTFEELSASLFNVAPLAAASGVEFNEVAAALATMTKQGVPTKVATTQLRAAIQAILKPTAEMAEALGLSADISGPVIDAYNDQREKLGQLQNSLASTKTELDEVRYSYIATTDEMKKLTGEIDELGDKQSEIRLQIRKLRYAAAREDRELTKEEIASIKSLELELDGLGISMDELRIKQDNTSEQAAEYNEQILTLEGTERSRTNAVNDASNALAEHQKEVDNLIAGSGKAMLSSEGLASTFISLAESAEGDINQLIKMFSSIEAVGAVLALTGDNADTFASDLEAMSHASDGAGASQEAFTEMNRGAARQFEVLTTQVKGVSIQIGMALMPAIVAIAKAITPLLAMLAN